MTHSTTWAPLLNSAVPLATAARSCPLLGPPSPLPAHLAGIPAPQPAPPLHITTRCRATPPLPHLVPAAPGAYTAPQKLNLLSFLWKSPPTHWRPMVQLRPDCYALPPVIQFRNTSKTLNYKKNTGCSCPSLWYSTFTLQVLVWIRTSPDSITASIQFHIPLWMYVHIFTPLHQFFVEMALCSCFVIELIMYVHGTIVQ